MTCTQSRKDKRFCNLAQFLVGIWYADEVDEVLDFVKLATNHFVMQVLIILSRVLHA